MGTNQSTMDYILGQIGDAGSIRAKKMFGEYALYCDEKVVALVCDDQLFVKPTIGGLKLLGSCKEASPYAGAKPYFLITKEQLANSKWIIQLIKITATELPIPKKKSV